MIHIRTVFAMGFLWIFLDSPKVDFKPSRGDPSRENPTSAYMEDLANEETHGKPRKKKIHFPLPDWSSNLSKDVSQKATEIAIIEE